MSGVSGASGARADREAPRRSVGVDGPDPILAVVDALDLDEARRRALRPGEEVRDPYGRLRTLPRWFYEVESWEAARAARLTENFTLHEFMTVDVREAAAVRRWPRYVPCGVTLLAAHLELVRQAAGALVWIAANGGYRSPSHALTDPGSPHCWATAANVYRVGEDLVEGEARVGAFIATVRRASPTLWIRPFGHDAGHADDHVHLDVGWVSVVPRGYGAKDEGGS